MSKAMSDDDGGVRLREYEEEGWELELGWDGG
jgi:hypothetical protein